MSAFVDPACTQPVSNTSFEVSNAILSQQCQTPSATSGALTAGFTQVEPSCVINTLSNISIADMAYYNTNEPPTSNTTDSGHCPSSYFTNRLVINVKGVNYTSTSCLPATLYTFFNTSFFLTSQVYGTFECIQSPPSNNAKMATVFDNTIIRYVLFFGPMLIAVAIIA